LPGPPDLLMALFVAGTALSAGTLIRLAWELAAAPARRRFERLQFTRSKEMLSDTLQRWAARAEKEMKQGVFRGFSPVQMVVTAVAGAAAFTTVAARFRNPLAAALAALLAVLLSVQYRSHVLRARREKIIEQLGAAVRVFSAEYSDTPLTARALDITARRMPEPIGGVLRKAASDLAVARNPDDVDRALVRLGRALHGEYGRMFTQLLRLSFEDQAVKPLFSKLAARITAQQDLIRKNRVEVAMDRTLALLLNILPAPAYFFISRVVPEASEFFLTTTEGKLTVCLCLLSAVLGSLMDVLLGGVEDG